MFMPGFEYYEVKKKRFCYYFSKRKWKYFYTFIVKSLQKEQNSTNLLLWPPICRNKSAITPKWFNSLDTNSSYPLFNSSNKIRWYVKVWSPQGAAPSFFTRVLEEMNKRCWLSEVEIKTADIYFFHKQRYCAIHLFTYRDLAFSEFPVGTYLRSRPATSKGAMRNLRFQIVLPQLLEFDTWQVLCLSLIHIWRCRRGS